MQVQNGQLRTGMAQKKQMLNLEYATERIISYMPFTCRPFERTKKENLLKRDLRGGGNTKGRQEMCQQDGIAMGWVVVGGNDRVGNSGPVGEGSRTGRAFRFPRSSDIAYSADRHRD